MLCGTGAWSRLVSRGIYRLAELPPLSDPDLVTVSLRYPNAVVCLVSALAFHDITTQIPHEVSVAVPRDSRLPSLDHPPVRAHRFSKASYDAGIETHRIDGAAVKVYDREKTLVDCFKFRNRIGMDIVLEALRLQRKRNGLNLGPAARLQSGVPGRAGDAALSGGQLVKYVRLAPDLGIRSKLPDLEVQQARGNGEFASSICNKFLRLRGQDPSP